MDPPAKHNESSSFIPTVDDPFSQRGIDGAYKVLDQPLGMRRKLRVICIGAGASGINMAYKVQSHLQDVEFVVGWFAVAHCASGTVPYGGGFESQSEVRPAQQGRGPGYEQRVRTGLAHPR